MIDIRRYQDDQNFRRFFKTLHDVISLVAGRGTVQVDKGDAVILERDWNKVHVGGPAWENNAVGQLAIIHYLILDREGRKNVEEPLDRITGHSRLLILEERRNKGFGLRARPAEPCL